MDRNRFSRTMENKKVEVDRRASVANWEWSRRDSLPEFTSRKAKNHFRSVVWAEIVWEMRTRAEWIMSLKFTCFPPKIALEIKFVVRYVFASSYSLENKVSFLSPLHTPPLQSRRFHCELPRGAKNTFLLESSFWQQQLNKSKTEPII